MKFTKLYLILSTICSLLVVKFTLGNDLEATKEIFKPEFQQIIDSANLRGAILVYDLEKDKYYSNDFVWSKEGKLPASTFKIPNSIIGLETGIIENENTIFFWDGEQRALDTWEQNLILKDAFQFSCVPCYQEVARGIGPERMKEYLSKYNYGSMEVDSANIDIFWLQGGSGINQFQQINFLKRLYKSELPISEKTEKIMKEILLLEENEQYKMSGKTGWSIQNGINNGWFVGYVESGSKIYYFATNVEPGEGFRMDMFPGIRKDVTFAALKTLDII